MTIVSAQKHHTEAILSLYQQLIHTLASLQPKHFQEGTQHADFIHQIIDADEADILLAVHEHEVVGFAMLQAQSTPHYPMLVPHHYAYLLDLVVAEHMRQRGIAQMLVNACKEWTISRRLAFLELGVLSNNQPALNLYAQQGFEAKTQTMCWTPLPKNS